VLQFLSEKGGRCREKDLKKHQGLSQAEWDRQLSLLNESGRVLKVGKDKLWDATLFSELATKIKDLLIRLASSAPWKGGWKAQELNALLSLKSGKDQGVEDVLEVLVETGELKRVGPLFSPAGHVPALAGEDAEKAERVLEMLEGDLFSPRDWTDCLQEVTSADKRVNERLESFLFGTEKVIRLDEKLVTTPTVLAKARERLKGSPQGFTASEARQILDTSRKYIIPILEWMDRQGWTVRMGDIRKPAP
jgi:selenocysteine-specific elongation factor